MPTLKIYCKNDEDYYLSDGENTYGIYTRKGVGHVGQKEKFTITGDLNHIEVIQYVRQLEQFNNKQLKAPLNPFKLMDSKHAIEFLNKMLKEVQSLVIEENQ